MNNVITIAIAIGLVIGGAAWIVDRNSAYGRKFEEGLTMVSSLILSMVGIICLSPIISWILSVLVAPLFNRIGLDPGILGGLLPLDMGGYHVSVELAKSAAVGRFAGTVVGAAFGCTLVFMIPVGMGMIEERDREIFSQGVLIGLLAIPVTLLTGGLVSGLGLIDIFKYSSPILLLIVLVFILMKKRLDLVLRIFSRLSQALRIIAVVGLILAAINYTMEHELIPGLLQLEEGMDVIVSITVFLLGALPMSLLMIRLLRRPVQWISDRSSLNEHSVIAFLIATISSVPAYAMIKDMDWKGKLMNTAYMVSGSAALGAHLAFTTAVEPSMVPALVAAKFAGGIAAVFLSLLLAPLFLKGE